jgi:hypothetical protein
MTFANKQDDLEVPQTKNKGQLFIVEGCFHGRLFAKGGRKMNIRETGIYCRHCGREMEFTARGMEEHEFVGTYTCRYCDHEEQGRYNEMGAFKPLMGLYELATQAG